MPSSVPRLVLFLLITSFGTAAKAEDSAPPRTARVQAKILPAIPQMDGQLGPVWTSASRIDAFEELFGKKLTQKTDVYVGYRGKALFFAFVCREDRMDRIIAAAKERDSIIYGDDCVELFINPDRNPRTYFHLQVNSIGTFTDRSCEFAETGQLFKRERWNAEGTEVAARCYKDRWIVEFKLPLAALGPTWRPGTSLGFNVARAEYPHNETSCWASMESTFHDPQRFGRLWFTRGVFIDRAATLSVEPGFATLKIEVNNVGNNAVDANLVFVFSNPQEGDVQKTRRISLAPKQVKSIVAKLPLGYGGGKSIRVELQGSANKTVYDSAVVTLANEGFQPRAEFVTPHTAWAKPLPKGKLESLFLLDYFHQRDVVELAQRMDLEYTSPIFIRDYWTYPEKPSAKEYADRIRKALEKELDVIVVGRDLRQKARHGASAAALPADIAAAVKRKVKAGAGLVLFAQEGIPPSWQGSLVHGGRNLSTRGNQTVETVVDHYLTRGIPFSVFKVLQLPVFSTSDTVLATAAGKPFLAVNQFGKGRVVVLGRSRNGLVPASASAPTYRQWNPMPTYCYWDDYFGFLAKCLLWAAGRDAEVTLTELRARPEILSCRLEDKGRGGVVQVAATVRDKFSHQVFAEAKEVRLAPNGPTEIKFMLPVTSFIDGRHFASVIISRDGKSVNWGATEFRVRSPARIAHVELDTAYIYKKGQPFLAYVKIGREGAAEAPGLQLDCVLRDRMGRVISRPASVPSPVGAKSVKVVIPLVNPVWRSFRAELSLGLGAHVLDRAIYQPVYYIPDRNLRDFGYFMWNWNHAERHPDYMLDSFYRRLLECGINGLENYYSLDLPLLEGMNFLADKHSPDFKAKIDRLGQLYNKTKDVAYLDRTPCLNDPRAYRQLFERNLKKLRPLVPQRPVGYFFGDEDTLTYEAKPIDFCFSASTLQAFRAWLRDQYGHLPGLNREWETTFDSWDKVVPMTKEQVRARGNAAPWADHRHFMQKAWTDAYARCKEWLQKYDPQARVGACGTRPLAAYTGIDWYRQLKALDFLVPYSIMKNQAEVQRSFSPCPKVMAAGLMEGKRQSDFIWKAALNDCRGIIFSKVSYAVRPDLSLTSKARFNKKLMGELTGGLGKLLLTSKRDQGRIGIYYSPASCFASWITEYRFGRTQRWRGPFHQSREAWLKLVQDLGMQCRFVHPEQVKSGLLEREGIRALILPCTLAMSDDETRAIESFVREGGLLIADYVPAAMDWHCRPRKTGGLDALFGIQSRGITTDFVEGKAVLTQAVLPALKNREILSGLSSAAVRVTTGQTMGTFISANRGKGPGQWPALVINRAGKGRTLYLNFLYEYRCDYTDPAAQALDRTLRSVVKATLAEVGLRAPLTITAAGREQSYLEVVPYRRDKADCFFILQDYLFPPGQANYHKERVQVTFASQGYVYDMRRRKFLGLARTVEVPLSPGDVTALCLLPYQVEAVEVAGPRRARPGTNPRFEIVVTASPTAPGNHVVRIEVAAPGGKRLPWYARNIEAPGGKVAFDVPLAVNDKSGTWTITARDVLSGVTGRSQIIVQP